jgi:hypothetical protein
MLRELQLTADISEASLCASNGSLLLVAPQLDLLGMFHDLPSYACNSVDTNFTPNRTPER